MEYKVLSVDSFCAEDVINILTQKVNSLCADGWKPQGGIAMIYQEGSESYEACQAMVK